LQKGLLNSPVLYPRATSYNKGRLLPPAAGVRDKSDNAAAWEKWVLYMLTAVEQTARRPSPPSKTFATALMDYKHRIRASYKFYSQDLINNLFNHPVHEDRVRRARPQGLAPDADQVSSPPPLVRMR
jgi:hypothetical protein